jgi:hypothetical protein
MDAPVLREKMVIEIEHGFRPGPLIATGTIVDATIINSPSSTKNAAKARDPEMHQTKKGNQWYFGMKAHVGVDSRTKLIHAIRRGVICLICGKPKPNQSAAFSACGLASSATPHQCHASLPRDQPLFRRSLTPQRATPRQVVDGLLQYQLTRGWRQCRPRYQASR